MHRVAYNLHTLGRSSGLLGCALAVALAGVARAQAPPPPAPGAPTPQYANDPATAARLAALGSRGVRLHDPSSVVRCKDEYWLFATGAGVPSYRSRDLVTWEPGPRVFPGGAPAWALEAVPANRGGDDFWAPEVVGVGDRYLLYYSVSAWGRNTSAIGLASNATLDPGDPAYRWVDHGAVIRSAAGRDDFNAIDPAVTLDEADDQGGGGRLWLSFGSFWGGIRMVELDPATGLRVAADSPVHALAWKEQIEGPYVVRRGGHYYLFVAWGWCCRGAASTYNVRVGRAERITGPYLDRDGRDMRDGGGTLVLDRDGPFVGPGQPSVLVGPAVAAGAGPPAAAPAAGSRDHLVCHFYDATTRRGRGTLAIRPLTWDEAGWPVVTGDD